MKRKKYINKTGVTLLSILLITSFVAISALSVAVADCMKVHNLERQITELQGELAEMQIETEPEQTEAPTETEPTETEPVPTEPAPTEPEPMLTSLGEFRLTAYCPCEKCCGVWATRRPDGIVYTASGAVAKEGRTIAVDPSVIPYGTSVIICGNEFVAEDCGGAIKQNRIDIYFESHQEALNFGVQYAEVFTTERSESSGDDLC